MRQNKSHSPTKSIAQRKLDAHWLSESFSSSRAGDAKGGSGVRAGDSKSSPGPACPRGMPWVCFRVQWLPGMGPALEVAAGVCSCGAHTCTPVT